MLTNTFMLARQIAKDDSPTEGLFYMVHVPHGWKLLAYFYDGWFGRRRISHRRFWQQEIVPMLAYQWSGVLAKDAESRKFHRFVLSRRLRGLVYAFPRGRIVKHDEQYVVLHGLDLTNRMPTKNKVERVFGIQHVCDWHFQASMRCKAAEVNKIKLLLGLEETWGK